MKKDSYYHLNPTSNDLLKQKQKLYTTAIDINPQSQISFSQSKKNISQNNFVQQPIQYKSYLTQNKGIDFTTKYIPTSQIPLQNPERIKSASFYEKGSKVANKLQYFSFANRQHREQREKKVVEIEKKSVFCQVDIDNKLIKDEMTNVKNRMEKYYGELKKKDEIILKKEEQIGQNKQQIQALYVRNKELQQQYQSYQANYTVLCQKYYNYQKEQQDYFLKVTKNYQIISQKCMQLEQILQQKDNHIQSIIASKNDQYNSAVSSKNSQIKTLQSRITILENDNSKLAQLNNLLENTDKKQNSTTDLSKFESFSQEIQAKLNYYVNQNNRLKNLVNNYEAQIQQLKTKHQSFEITLKAYQERDSMEKTSQLQLELLSLRQALEAEKEQNDRLMSKQELKILKLQNAISSRRLQQSDSLIDLYDQERLHESLYLALAEVERLKTKLSEAVKK